MLICTVLTFMMEGLAACLPEYSRYRAVPTSKSHHEDAHFGKVWLKHAMLSYHLRLNSYPFSWNRPTDDVPIILVSIR